MSSASQPVLGRTFAPGEDQPGKSLVVVLSHRLWENRFGADPSIIGRTLTLNAKPYTVIGVMPANSSFDRTFEQLWTPLAFDPRDMTRDYHWLLSFARLKPGVSLEKAQGVMNAIGARIAETYPQSNKGWGVTVERLEDRIVGNQLRSSLLVLLAAVGAILLIGCANLANLTLARGAAREREIAVRASLGAGTWRLIRQVLVENLLVAGAGGALGLALGYAMIRGLIWLAPPFSLPSEANVSIDPAILLFTLAISLITALLFGLAPAIHATRVDPASSMKEGGRSASSGAGRARLRSALIVSEVALAFVLLAGAGLLLGSFYRMLQVDTGFTSTNITTAHLPIARDRFPQPAQLLQYVRLLDQRLRAIPGARDVAFTNVLPMEGWGDGMPFLIAGRPFVDRANRRACFYKRVTSTYFRTLDIPLLRGRTFTGDDTRGGAPVIVINQEMAKRYFKGEDPIGKRILIQEILYGQPGLGPEIPWEVVGIVGDEQTGSLIDTKDPGLYVTFDQSPTDDVNMVLRGSVDPRTLTSAIYAAVHAVDKDQSIAELQTLEQIKTGTVASDRMQDHAAGHFRRAGIAVGGHRHLWRHQLFGHPAHPRIGHSRGTGRQPWQPARHGDSPRHAPHRCWASPSAQPAHWRSRTCSAACCSASRRATRSRSLWSPRSYRSWRSRRVTSPPAAPPGSIRWSRCVTSDCRSPRCLPPDSPYRTSPCACSWGCSAPARAAKPISRSAR